MDENTTETPKKVDVCNQPEFQNKDCYYSDETHFLESKLFERILKECSEKRN